MSSIGQRIKQRRLYLGYTVEQVADLLGKNKATVYRYENNDIEKMPITVLAPLAKILKTSPAYLMGWEDESANWINNPNVLTDNLEDTVKYILEHEDKRILQLYKDLVTDDKLVLLLDKATKLSPEAIVQLLKIVDTFKGDEQKNINNEVKDPRED